MSSELLVALAPLLDRLQVLVKSDPKLRQEVFAVGHALCQWAEGVMRRESPSIESRPLVVPPPQSGTPLPFANPLTPRRVDDTVTPPPSGTDEAGWMPQEPAVIAARCRAKGEATKLLAKKYANAIDDAQFAKASVEVRAQADKLPKCTLWMLDMLSLTRAAVVWEDLVGGYTAAAMAAELVQAVTEPGTKIESDYVLQALNLAAEAQSLLFSAVIDTGNPRPDADQIQLYVTVRECAAARGVYIHRYLRREDRVDPRSWPGLLKRVSMALEPFTTSKRQSAAAKKVLANLRFKLKKAVADGFDRFDEWPRVMELLDEAITAGVEAANAELHEILLPVIDGLPDELPASASAVAVFREIDRALAKLTKLDFSAVPLTDDVITSRPHLHKQVVVVVGGQLRTLEKQFLEQTFEPTELAWVGGADLVPGTTLESLIARPATSLVMFASRWANVEFPEVQRLCTAHSKWLVRLPGGYHPNAVARQILRQQQAARAKA
ncbi:hypothetical protein [Limnoglobus roseus]|uniref:DUF2325 domain-containing protein n=1 Tax=Limnoglobus roseus TaxID=2598579 RepID=A0A5C1AG16_9BACT|nr:hypothetical protein [Limnoglobus roseus]QEL17077.1 hypothetical protein PX52LOC_04053 [Limnoglobus roseus]